MPGKKLVWHQTGEKRYETGVSDVALFPYDGSKNIFGPGVAWNGVTAIKEKASGAEAKKQYADNIDYITLRSIEEFEATIEAFMYPNEWKECDGSKEIVKGFTLGQQTRRIFGLAYKTIVGNDVKYEDFGYKLHLIYNATASPSDRENKTINENQDINTMSWECKTTPIRVEGFKPAAHFVLDSTVIEPAKLKEVEAKIYGSEQDEPTLILPDAIKAIIGSV